MKSLKSRRTARLATALSLAAALLVSAPEALSQGTLNVSEAAFEDFSDDFFEPTVFEPSLGAGVNTISGVVSVFFVGGEFGYDSDLDYFQVLNPSLLSIESITVTITGFSPSGEMVGGIIELLDNAIPTFALSGGAEKGMPAQFTSGHNSGQVIVFGEGMFQMEAVIDDPAALKFSVSPPDAIDGGFDYTITIVAVPEPSTWALLGCGLGAIGMTLWRRQRG